jgi:hypothetical protein
VIEIFLADLQRDVRGGVVEVSRLDRLGPLEENEAGKRVRLELSIGESRNPVLS